MLRRGALVLASVSLAGCLSVSDPVSKHGSGGTGAHAGSGGSTASGGTFPGSGGTSGAGTGGGSGSENCLNGSDDDGDSKVDCADPDCTPSYECVDVPAGWQLGLSATAAWSASLPSPAPCANGDAAVRLYEGPAGPAACATCACGALSGSCGDTPITCALGNVSCTGATVFNVATCYDFNAPTNNQISCVLGPTPLANASCGASTAALTNPDPWQSVRDVCALGSGGCSIGQACVPKQSPASPVCISIDGTAACPGTFPSSNVDYASGNDTRSCSDCTCSPNGASCEADTFNFMTMASCIDFGPFPTFYGTSCVSYVPSTSSTSWSIQRQPATNKTPTGSCAASGGVPSGSMSPSGKKTVCCR